MPFITQAQFEGYASQAMVSVMKHNADAFTQAERGAGQIITRITGVPSPTDVVDAPEWSVQPACWLVYDIMLDSLNNVTPEIVERARQARKKAIEELEGWKKGDAPPTVGAAETGKAVSELW